jgi:hypothetical protein
MSYFEHKLLCFLMTRFQLDWLSLWLHVAEQFILLESKLGSPV